MTEKRLKAGRYGSAIDLDARSHASGGMQARNTVAARSRMWRTSLAAAGMFMLEAAVFIGVMAVARPPARVQAINHEARSLSEDEAIVEMLVLDDRMLNTRSGLSHLSEVEIWIHVRQKHGRLVADDLSRFANDIKSQLMTIWRTAEPRDLDEPGLERLTDRVHELLAERFGRDPGSGEPIVLKSFFVAGPAFRIDG